MGANLNQLLRDFGIICTYNRVPTNPNMPGKLLKHYKVTLSRVFKGRRDMTLFYSTGSAIKNPTTDDVVECLIMDTEFFESTGSFNEWFKELGLTEPEEAWASYQTTEQNVANFKEFMGDLLPRAVAAYQKDEYGS